MKNQTSKLFKEFIQKEKQLIIGLIILFGLYLAVIIQQFLFVHQNIGIVLQIILNGTVASVIYSILALGFSLIYGIAKQLKLSAGGYYVLAAYTMYFLLNARRIELSLPTDIDSLVLFGLYLLPICLLLIVLIILFTQFNRKQFILLLISTAISIGAIVFLNILLPNLFPSHSLLEGFYTALALLSIGLGAWYLELPKYEITIGILILSVSIPVIMFIKLPVVHLALMISAVMFTACIAMISDRYLLNKMRHNHVNIMITTFALALLIQSIIQIFFYPKGGKELVQFGPQDYTLSAIVSISKILRIYGALILEVKIVAFIFVLFGVILLYLFIWKTRMGVALRAVSQDEEASALTGIDIRKTTAIVSGIGMGLIAFAAVLTSPFAVTLWNPYMGWWILILSIAIVTLGGLGSLPGSIIAAFIIGFAEIIVSSIPAFASLSSVLPFIIVFIVMIIKPEGLLGEKKELEG